MRIKDIILSWDFWFALVFALLLLCLLPSEILNKTASSLFSVATTVLSIIFSIYFASLAIIIASPADDFVYFMEQKGLFTSLLSYFKFTLGLLFFGLIAAIIGYSFSVYIVDLKGDKSTQTEYIIVLYSFLFWYSLFASIISIGETIKYSRYRMKFLKYKSENAKRKEAGVQE